MKLTDKKKDAIGVIGWAVLCMANMIAMFATGDSLFGFMMLFNLICLLEKDRECKDKYPEKKEQNNEL